MLNTARFLLRASVLLSSPSAVTRAAGAARLDLARRLMKHGGAVDLSGHEVQREFADLLSTFVPSRHSLRLQPDTFPCQATLRHDFTFRFGGAIIDSNRAPVGVVQRRLVLAQRLAVHEFLYLVPEVRGAGLGPQILRDSLRLYDRLGITTIQLQASLETGRWYWGYLGWDFVDPASRHDVLFWAAQAAAALGQAGAVAGIGTAYGLAHLDTGTPATFRDLASAFPARAAELAVAADKNAIGLDDAQPLGRLIMLSAPDWLGGLDLRGAQRGILETYLQSKLGSL